jgi:hypothetical protein
VREAFTGEGFEVTIWRRGSGTGGFPPIREQDKAVRLAEFLYNELLPEYEADNQRMKEIIRRMDAEMAKRPKPKPPKVKKNAPVIKVLICPECSELIAPEDVSDARVYECGECGTKGTGDDGRRCDQCHKFTAKISDTSCPECSGPMDDAEETEASNRWIAC